VIGCVGVVDSGSADGGALGPSTADAGPGRDAGPIPDAGMTTDAAYPTDAGVSSVDAGSGVFVAVGYGGRTLRSLDDGLSWVDDQWLVPQGGDDVYLLRAVAYGAGQFVAVGWRVMTSPDGKTWADAGVMSQWLGGIAYAQNAWVAAGGYGRRSHSADGVQWTDAPYDGRTQAYRALTYDDASARWIAVGDQGVRESTSDGVTWLPATGDAGTGLGAVAAGEVGWSPSAAMTPLLRTTAVRHGT